MFFKGLFYRAGKFVFDSNVQLRDPDLKQKQIFYGLWEFEDGTEFPEFSAGQMTDALLWTRKNAIRQLISVQGGSYACVQS